MKCTISATATAIAAVLLVADPARAVSILSPADTIIGVDLDENESHSRYPGGEPPQNTVDGTTNKYLNFEGANSGFIVTPAFGSSVVQSFQITTANDAPDRDPTSFELYGTNDAIVSTDNSLGTAEAWDLIDGFDLTGGFALPGDRNTAGPVVPITNATAYTSYKMLFPTVGGSTLMQIGEVSFFESSDGTGTDVLESGDPILAIDADPFPDSDFPENESPEKAIDGIVSNSPSNKYLNFGKENAGFIVTPESGPSVLKTFVISTANDFEGRDPASWQLFGTNDPIQSTENSRADGGENWTLIAEDDIEMPLGRGALGPYVQLDNDTEYTSYLMVFPTLRDTDGDRIDSLQFGEIQFYSEHVPEPSTALLGLAAIALGAAVLRKRHR